MRGSIASEKAFFIAFSCRPVPLCIPGINQKKEFDTDILSFSGVLQNSLSEGGVF
jgi:hypothetical protein